MHDVAAQRVRGFGTSIFTEMSRLASEHNAVNLGQGFPDFPGPDFVKEAAKKAIDANANQYAVSFGSPRLRQEVGKTWFGQTGQEIDIATEVTVTTGATEAIFDVMQAFTDEEDEIVVFEPFYDSYPASAAMASSRLRLITLHAPDWRFDPEEARAAFGPRTKLLLLNTPHKPTGKVFRREELELLADLCQQWDVIAVTDEVYDRITFGEAEHLSLATIPGMRERTLTINSTGKTFSMTGWKIGYAIGPAEHNAALRAVHQFVTFATATPFQEAMADALDLAPQIGYYEQLKREYDERRVMLDQALAGAGLPVLPVQGAYFLMADVSGLGFPDDVSFCQWLTSEVGVAAVPPSAFYADVARAPLLARFCFAKREDTIAQAAERLQRLPALLP